MQKKPETAFIRFTDMIVDDKYQRALRKFRAKEIGASFNTNAVGLPAVSRRKDGKFAIVDGQTRAAAAEVAGLSGLWCEVVPLNSVTEEAEVFCARNGNRGPVTAMEMFRARLVSKEPVALEIDGIVKANGFVVDIDTKKNGTPCWPKFTCVSALERVHSEFKMLAEVLGILNQCLPETNDACKGMMVLGVARFLRNCGSHENFRRERMHDVLFPDAMRKLWRRSLALAEVIGGSAEYNLARALMEAYNTRLAASRRLPKALLFAELIED